MTPNEMIKAVEEDNITEELINALIEFEWEYDTYDIMDSYGHIDDDGVRDMMVADLKYTLEVAPEEVINYIKEMTE